MKYITISKIGYNHPSNANWSYGIWQVSTIDTSQDYSMSYTVRESFGGDSRFRKAIFEKTGQKVLEVKGVYPNQKCTGIRTMESMENKEFIQEMANFLTE